MQGTLGQLARRLCNARGEWNPTNYSECATLTESVLTNISSVSLVASLYAVIKKIYYVNFLPEMLSFLYHFELECVAFRNYFEFN